MSAVPEKWRAVYGLNPMVTVVEGFRWSLLDTPPPDATLAFISSVALLATMTGGVMYFKATERTFADVI